jgi:hypothetical protein
MTDGEIVVLSQKGEAIGKVSIPDYPEIMGMHFSKYLLVHKYSLGRRLILCM